jgi:hypothetical protein
MHIKGTLALLVQGWVAEVKPLQFPARTCKLIALAKIASFANPCKLQLLAKGPPMIFKSLLCFSTLQGLAEAFL